MKQTEETLAWLRSPAAQLLRKRYAEQATMSANATMSAAMESTDPKVRALATGYATWKAAIKELEVTNDSDE